MIVVTAPTSNIGRQVLEHLLDGEERVRVVARDPSRLTPQVRERFEIVQGSHGDVRVAHKAFEGADTVFWLVPPDPRAKSVEAAFVGFTGPACEAIQNEGVRRVVSISALGRGTPVAAHAGYVTGSLAMDDRIIRTGVDYRALTMPSFMDNILHQAGSIKNAGAFFSPISGDRKTPSCATRDIATVASTLLLDPSWTGQGHVAVLGPEDLSFNDMARTMSDILGKPVRFEQIPFDVYKSRFIEFGMSEAMAQGMTDMAMAKDKGLDNAEPRTAENTTPTTFRQWCAEVLKPVILG